MDRPSSKTGTGVRQSGTMLTLAFDMRAPELGANPMSLYAAALEQCAWADSLGFTDVQLMEHHASTDGYLPSPIVLGSAVAGVTSRLAIRLCLVLLPLYDPLRVAEDLAVLDLISGGRLRLTVGMGYRQEEYEQFGVDMRRRPSLMEEAVETLQARLDGRAVRFPGTPGASPPAARAAPAPLDHHGGRIARQCQTGCSYCRCVLSRRPEALRDLPRRALGLGKESVCRGWTRRDHL